MPKLSVYFTIQVEVDVPDGDDELAAEEAARTELVRLYGNFTSEAAALSEVEGLV